MKKLIATIIVSACAALCAFCAVMEPVKSKSMGKTVNNMVILPDGYEDSGKSYPVVYLLHGFGDNHETWLRQKPQLPALATRHQIIIVCPDGAKSWYWDSPKDPKSRYDTYVSKELVNFIDGKYRTIKNKGGRAVVGLSMGGQGAMYLAIAHPDVFGAAASMSGGVDIRPFPNNWDMKKSLGKYEENKEIWDMFAVVNNVEKIKQNPPAISIDCGVDDFFYKVNEELHKKLLALKIPHDYTTRPGKHNWDYWRNSIEYQLHFFDTFFRGELKR
ncbi:MAG: esterase family protein [Opitutales bacterium]|nr:esterase family protein [Opitutales bacterium]